MWEVFVVVVFRKGVGFVCWRHLDTIYSCLINHSMWRVWWCLFYYMFFFIVEKYQKARGIIIFLNCIGYYSIAFVFFITCSFPLLKSTKKLDLLSFSWILQATPLTRPDRYSALHSLDACRFITFWITTEIIDRSGFDLLVSLKSLGASWYDLFVPLKSLDVTWVVVWFIICSFPLLKITKKLEGLLLSWIV